MKKRFAGLLLIPLVLTSCGHKGVSFDDLQARIDNIAVSEEHPYYRVVGVLDFNNSVTEVDAQFVNMPDGETFVPYARFNPGFYLPMYETNSEEDTIYSLMASRSYWLRVPLKIDRTNFIAYDEDGNINSSCVFASLQSVITSWFGQVGSANPSSCYAYYELNDDGGFVIAGDKVHTNIRIDNYPCYPDTGSPYQAWDADVNAFPAYKNTVDGKFNIRFEYNKDGWLKREYLASIDYDYSKSSASQVCLESRYYYQNDTTSW